MRKSLKVFHLPANIASLMSHNIQAERHLGINSRGLAWDESVRVTNDGIDLVPVADFPLRLWYKLVMIWKALRGIAWADVVHWYGATRLFGIEKIVWKPKVHTWCGAEVRKPFIEMRDNPYFTEGEYPYDAKRVKQNELTFSDYTPILENPSTCLYTTGFYLGRGITEPYRDGTIDLEYILHVGSQPKAKGTDRIEPILKKTGKPYEIARDLSRHSLLLKMLNCRIFVGQFILGDIGMAEIEAMWMGKPVLAYLKPKVLQFYPPGLPIVNCTLDTLGKELRRLYSRPKLCRKIGKACQMYAEEHFNALNVATRRLPVYEGTIGSFEK